MWRPLLSLFVRIETWRWTRPSIPGAKGELTSDKQPLIDNKSLFDAVPLFFPM
jgi:hypothetical protein